MSFNLQKCEFLRITHKKNPIVVQYTLHDNAVHEVTHAKCLGVVIDSKLSWSEHIKQVTDRANKVKGFLQHNFYNCPMSIKTNCYKSMIKPIVEYACTIWAPHTHRRTLLLLSQFRGVLQGLSAIITPPMQVSMQC